MEQRKAAEQAAEGGEQREKDGFHACDPTMAVAEKSMNSRSTEFLVGISSLGLGRFVNG